MYKSFVYLFAMLTSLAMVSCSRLAPQPENKPVPAEKMMKAAGPMIPVSLDLLVSSRDTVCGMSLKGGVADTVVLSGKIFGFCSPGCKKTFLTKQSKS